eukprot:7121517-Karenia_brevis.AAC.1
MSVEMLVQLSQTVKLRLTKLTYHRIKLNNFTRQEIKLSNTSIIEQGSSSMSDSNHMGTEH